jgi:hypothetical protein
MLVVSLKGFNIDLIMLITLGLGIIESMLLNIASLENKMLSFKVTFFIVKELDAFGVIPLMVKAILLEINCLLTCNVGLFLGYIGNIVRYMNWVFVYVYKSGTTSYPIRIIKDKSLLPKSGYRTSN